MHSIITGRVTKVNPRFASVAILCVGNTTLKEEFKGIIRLQEVRSAEIDKVEMYKCFRPGDIVKAEVVLCSSTKILFQLN